MKTIIECLSKKPYVVHSKNHHNDRLCVPPPSGFSRGMALIIVMAMLLSVIVTVHAEQKPYSAQYPVFEPSGADFKDKDKKRQAATIQGTQLQGSIGSVDRHYARGRLPRLESITNCWSGVAWRGERVHTQLVLFSKGNIQQLRFESTQMLTKDGVALNADLLHPQFVRYVLSESYLYPDILDPVERLDLPANTTRPVWVTLEVPRNAGPGRYFGKVGVLATGGVRLDFTFELEVLPLTLPAPKDWKFYLDLWQNPFAIARWHGVKPWSDKHFSLMEPYWRMLAEAGQKCLTVSLFHHPWGAQVYDGLTEMITWTHKGDGTWEYDFSLLDKYVAFAERVGLDDQINCYSMIPWSNQFRYLDGTTGDWKTVEAKPGEPAYEAHWKPFLKALEQHVHKKGWKGRLTIAMDERPEKDVLAAHSLLRKYAPSVRIASATNHPPKKIDLDDWSPYIRNPVDPEVVRKRNEEPGLVTTFYVCCMPPRPNTFTHSPPAESAWMGLYAAAHNRSGFLRWAYNSWNENPFYETKYWAKKWAAGDCFLIYPGPRSSIRFERLREGIQDYEKIRILRELAAKQENVPEVRQAIQSLNKTLSMIDFKTAQTTSAAKQVNTVKASILKLSRVLAR